jgi:hypothetical protein
MHYVCTFLLFNTETVKNFPFPAFSGELPFIVLKNLTLNSILKIVLQHWQVCIYKVGTYVEGKNRRHLPTSLELTSRFIKHEIGENFLALESC